MDFTEARESEWQWHQLGHMQLQVCTSLPTDNHSMQHPTTQFLETGSPCCRPTNSVKALKAHTVFKYWITINSSLSVCQTPPLV